MSLQFVSGLLLTIRVRAAVATQRRRVRSRSVSFNQRLISIWYLPVFDAGRALYFLSADSCDASPGMYAKVQSDATRRKPRQNLTQFRSSSCPPYRIAKISARVLEVPGCPVCSRFAITFIREVSWTEKDIISRGI